MKYYQYLTTVIECSTTANYKEAVGIMRAATGNSHIMIEDMCLADVDQYVIYLKGQIDILRVKTNSQQEMIVKLRNTAQNAIDDLPF